MNEERIQQLLEHPAIKRYVSPDGNNLNIQAMTKDLIAMLTMVGWCLVDDGWNVDLSWKQDVKRIIGDLTSIYLGEHDDRAAPESETQ